MKMSITRRNALSALLACAAAPRAAANTAAAYPTRPIQLVVPFPAGGAVDVTARLVAEKLRSQLGQPVVVENRAGANGMIGATAVAHAAPDGHTLLMAPREVFSINPILASRAGPEQRHDFAYVGIVATGPYVLVVNPGLGVSSLFELVSVARGRELAYASFGKGSMAHLNIETLCRSLNLKMRHIPYRGAPPAVLAVVTGEVALTISTAPAALSFIQEGKLKAIAVGGASRFAQLPDTPTMSELGIADDPLVSNFFGLAAPAGTPSVIIDRLINEVSRAVTQPDFAARIDASGLTPAPGSPRDMAKTVSLDIERFGKLIRELDIKSD